MDIDELADIRQAATEFFTDTCDVYKNLGVAFETAPGDVSSGGQVTNIDGRGGVTSVSDTTDSRGGGSSNYVATILNVPCCYQARIDAKGLQLIADRPANLIHAAVYVSPLLNVLGEDRLFIRTPFYAGMVGIVDIEHNTDGATIRLLIEYAS